MRSWRAHEGERRENVCPASLAQIQRPAQTWYGPGPFSRHSQTGRTDRFRVTHRPVRRTDRFHATLIPPGISCCAFCWVTNRLTVRQEDSQIWCRSASTMDLTQRMARKASSGNCAYYCPISALWRPNSDPIAKAAHNPSRADTFSPSGRR